MLYLIQGIFFQEQTLLGLIEDRAAVLETEIRCMYSGVIFPDKISPGNGIIGKVFDRFGDAQLFDVQISPNRLHFVKMYSHREDEIIYDFRFDGKMWIGGYFGPETGRGGSRCILTETSKEFFAPVIG